MSGPPANIPPNALFEALCQLPRPSRVVDFPRTDPSGSSIAQIALRVLTQQERMVAVAESEAYAKRVLKEIVPRKGEDNRGYQDVYNNELSVQILYRAARRVDDEQWPFFPSPTAMRDKLTGDEIGVLMSTYLLVQTEIGPIVNSLEPEEVDQWIQRLVEGGSANPLGLLSSDGLADLVMHLASRLYSSLTATSSSGSPADESHTPTSAD